MKELQLKIQIMGMIALVALAIGCASMEARDKLAQAEAAYAATLEMAVELRESGVIDDDLARELTPVFVQADRILADASAFIRSGELDRALEKIRAAEALILVIADEIGRL